MDRRIVIGLGTGRCGTYTLHRLLSKQHSSRVEHEMQMLPWEVNKERVNHLMSFINYMEESTVGDVGFYWLNYVPDAIEKWGEKVRFVCLKRDKTETINSWMRKTPTMNFWSDQGNFDKSILDEAFPTYKGVEKREAIAMYYDNYYSKAKEYSDKYMNFRIFPIEAFNTREGQVELLDFVFGDDEYELNVGIKSNVMGESEVFVEAIGIKDGDCYGCGPDNQAEYRVHDKNTGCFVYSCEKCIQEKNLGYFNY